MAITYSFVSLLDVLGYKNKINEDRQNGNEAFKSKLDASLAVLAGINEAEINYQAISDTIIISANSAFSFTSFLQTLSSVHLAFLQNDLLIRGGVAFAPHFKSGPVTYSHALPVAYELEQKQAVYPRIVIDKNIIEMIRPGGKLEGDSGSITSERLICVENGIHFVNVAGGQANQYYDLAKKIYEAEESSLDGNEHELAKHRWLQNYIIAVSGDPKQPYMGTIRTFEAP